MAQDTTTKRYFDTISGTQHQTKKINKSNNTTGAIDKPRRAKPTQYRAIQQDKTIQDKNTARQDKATR